MDLLTALRGEGDFLTKAEAWGGVGRDGRRGTGARHCAGGTTAVCMERYTQIRVHKQFVKHNFRKKAAVLTPGWSIRALTQGNGGSQHSLRDVRVHRGLVLGIKHG